MKKTFDEMKRGGTYLIEGLNLVANEKTLLSRLSYNSLVTIAVCVASSAACFVLSFPMRIVGVYATFNACLYFVSVIALQIMRVVMPNFSSDVFFMSLALQSPSRSRKIREKPVLRSVYQIVFTMILEIIFGLGALGIFIFFWGSLSPVLIAALVSTMAFLGPALWIGILIGILLLMSLCFCCTRSRLFQIMSRARKISTLFAITIVVLVITGILRGSALQFTMNLIYAFIVSLYIAEQLLTQYSIRLEENVWKKWRDAHKYSLIGFGLPIYVLITYIHPFVALLLLQLLQGAAAVYLGYELDCIVE